MTIVSPTIFIVFFVVVGLYLVNRLVRGNGLPLPPGPKGVPFLGNINDMPKSGVLECHHWLQHKELYGAYGSEFSPWSTALRSS
jgi:hypothetical protein